MYQYLQKLKYLWGLLQQCLWKPDKSVIFIYEFIENVNSNVFKTVYGHKTLKYLHYDAVLKKCAKPVWGIMLGQSCSYWTTALRVTKISFTSYLEGLQLKKSHQNMNPWQNKWCVVCSSQRVCSDSNIYVNLL